MHDQLNISDYKQYYEFINNHQGNPGEFSWQNVDWIMSPRTTLTPTQKLEQISTAILYTGHGSSVHDLKEMSDIARGTPCSPELVKQLCDCPVKSAYDLGRGRGNPEDICIGHKCWGIATNLPRNKISPQMLQLWFNRYGCELKSECPLGFCIHIKDSIVDNKEEVLDMVREVKKYIRPDDKRIAAINFGNLRPSPWMAATSRFQEWRCAADGEHFRGTTIPVHGSDEIANLPLSHMDTPTQSVVQVMSLRSSSLNVYQGQTLDSEEDDGHLADELNEVSSTEIALKNKPPEILVTLPKKTSEEEQLTEPGYVKSILKMVWSSGKPTPLGQVIAICVGILTLMAGAAVFGGVTNKIISDDANRRYRRGTNISTLSGNEQGIAALFEEARAKKMRMKQQDAISYPGQIPIRIFTDQLVVIAFEQNLGALEDHVKFAIEYLSEAQFSFDECRKIWGEPFMEEKAQEICAENIAAINGNIRAALHPIERAQRIM